MSDNDLDYVRELFERGDVLEAASAARFVRMRAQTLPRFKTIPGPMWNDMQRQWEEWNAPGGFLSREAIEANIERARQTLPPDA